MTIIQRPKTVSAGSVLCRLTMATKIAGTSQQASSSTRIRHWVSSLTISNR